MKKLFAILLLTISSSVLADGQYDGVWYAEGIGYYSVHEKDSQALVVTLGEDGGVWEAYMGPINDNSMKITSLKGTGVVKAVINIVMTSDTTFTAVQESCERIYTNYYCMLPNGYTFNGKKVW